MTDSSTKSDDGGVEQCSLNDDVVNSSDIDSELSDDDHEEQDNDPDNNTNYRNNKAEEAEDLNVATKENNYVWFFRLVTSLVLLCVAIGVCIAVLFQGKDAEQQDFEDGFVALGEKLVTSFEETVIRRLQIVDNLALSLTAEAEVISKATGQNDTVWPFFTPTDYQQRAGNTANLAGVLYMLLLPLVETDEKLEWEAYSRQNQGWIAEGLAEQMGVEPEDVNARPITPVMISLAGGSPAPVSGPGPYFPIWTEFPANNFTFTNLDPYSNPDGGRVYIDACLNSKKPTFPESRHFLNDTEEERESDFIYQRVRAGRPDYEGHPYFTSYYPVFDHSGKEDKEIVAVLLGGSLWEAYFESSLPEGTESVHVILENACDQVFTYEVRGSISKFIGIGDLHDTDYDYLAATTSVDSLIGLEKDDSLIVDVGNCGYEIRVYPTKEFEESYYTNKPLTNVIVLAAVFIFTCSVFLLYDYMVERRQKVVMRSAQQSGKLVSSLFPEDVRKRLYEEEENKRKQENNQATTNWKASSSSEQDQTVENHAIATLYPETTCCFADLAGFTQWSSSRTPEQVFNLLETLYGAFDSIASRYKVFKVETIGDCYMAVTGLPVPQPNHAVIMTKFARACLSKMHVLIANLTESLGEDTSNLEMRIGLHSGPVTAGVLRGQKSRFQLFGDTVNTAARMESNGAPGRIHASQATADALTVAGKGYWLSAREDKIIAKGKGEMQTFWVNVKGSPEHSTGEVSFTISSRFSQGDDGSDPEDDHSPTK